MADYLFSEAEVSDNDEPMFENIIDPITKEDVDLFLNLLYALRHAKTGEYSHTTELSCLNEEMLQELEGIKSFVQLDRINPRISNKLHLINDILIPYGFFLKVYVIQKKFQFINLGGQEKLKRKCE